MQGWTPDFIPKLAEDASHLHLIDEVMPIDGTHALEMTKELAQKEGIFCGTSGGATFSGAMKVAEKAAPNSTILCMLPDTGERYLSTPLFEGIQEEMNDEEMDISRSTPGYRFDVKSTPAPTPAEPESATEEKLDVEAENFVNDVLNDPKNPVVLFALEWCEFCWSLRKLLAKLEIPYRAIDLDSVAFQKDEMGGKIRAVLRSMLSTNTIPQFFISGHQMGGATDTFEAFNSGALKEHLAKAGIEMANPTDLNPYELLPNWLHKR
jgi:cysteine synthase A